MKHLDGFLYKEKVDIPFTSISAAYLGKVKKQPPDLTTDLLSRSA